MRTCSLWMALTILVPSLSAQQIKDFKFEITTLGGQKLTQANFAENVLIVDLWGTWCPPCREAIPALVDLSRRYKQEGLEILGLNYEGKPDAEATRTIRMFAAEHGIPYPLAIGTPAVQKQVPNFRGYPTLLFFKKGLEFDHLTVGFGPQHKKEIEKWVRTALGLEEGSGDEAKLEEEKPPEDEPEAQPKPQEREPLPKGVIFKPGDADSGFEFEVLDLDGKTLKFSDLRGKPVLLALTSTWDGEAANTAKVLNAVCQARGETVHVLAASLEMKKSRDDNVAAIRDFATKHALRYRVFPANLGFQKKVHMFTGMPLFLVFDKEGVLQAREGGASYDKIKTALEEALDRLK